MRTRVMTLVMLALLPAAAWAAPVDQGALDRCIARNTLRFTQPGDALAAQYVDIAAACRAAPRAWARPPPIAAPSGC